MWKYKKLFYSLVVILFCLKSNDALAYHLSEDEVREMETLDNELCLARGHELGDEYSIRLYWACRLDLIDRRIAEAFTKRNKEKFYTTELKRIKKVMINVITKIESEFREKLNYYTKKKQDNIELRGKDKYYYNLLTFLNYDYTFLNINNQREIRNIIETRKKLSKDKEKINIKKNLEKYPECIVYDINSKEFTKCIEFKLEIEECRKAVIEKLNNKEIENKFTCKQQSMEKYPDYMALYNSEYQDLKNEKVDLYNINRQKQEEKEKRMAELNRLMSGPRLSNVQLINLRKFEEKKCLIDKELENNLFKLTISGECENIIKNARDELEKQRNIETIRIRREKQENAESAENSDNGENSGNNGESGENTEAGKPAENQSNQGQLPVGKNDTNTKSTQTQDNTQNTNSSMPPDLTNIREVMVE